MYYKQLLKEDLNADLEVASTISIADVFKKRNPAPIELLEILSIVWFNVVIPLCFKSAK